MPCYSAEATFELNELKVPSKQGKGGKEGKLEGKETRYGSLEGKGNDALPYKNNHYSVYNH